MIYIEERKMKYKDNLKIHETKKTKKTKSPLYRERERAREAVRATPIFILFSGQQ
jgi:hypothetical protein